jgi:hypothetical protein
VAGIQIKRRANTAPPMSHGRADASLGSLAGRSGRGIRIAVVDSGVYRAPTSAASPAVWHGI